jgi:hypothetical protein
VTGVEATGGGRATVEDESGVGGCGIDKSGVRKSMRLFAQSTNGLCWHNQLNPMTAEMSGSSGVTRKLTSRIVPGANWTGMVTS